MEHFVASGAVSTACVRAYLSMRTAIDCTRSMGQSRQPGKKQPISLAKQFCWRFFFTFSSLSLSLFLSLSRSLGLNALGLRLPNAIPAMRCALWKQTGDQQTANAANWRNKPCVTHKRIQVFVAIPVEMERGRGGRREKARADGGFDMASSIFVCASVVSVGWRCKWSDGVPVLNTRKCSGMRWYWAIPVDFQLDCMQFECSYRIPIQPAGDMNRPSNMSFSFHSMHSQNT